ncbi:hypothetical protein [Streptomyces sp. NPDC048349]|uniref:hypothetical protein n=1 Tax=Streptomyces sp. NPDC048349 TaxID=3155486 RepID=UPI00342A8827
MDRTPQLPQTVRLPALVDGLSRNPGLPEDLALRLAPLWPAALGLALRRGAELSDALCAEFLAHGRAAELALAQALPPGTAARLAAHPDPEVRAERAEREGAAEGRHGLFAADPEAAVRLALAKNPELSAQRAQELAGDTDPRVRAAVARRESAPDETVHRALLTDPEARVRAAACRHRPPDDLHAALLADPVTRPHVIGFVELDPATADRLAADPDDRVREALAAHPGLPRTLCEVLARDPDPGVRGQVFRRADLAPELRGEIHSGLVAGARRADEDREEAEEPDFLCKVVLAMVEFAEYGWVAADPLPHVGSPYVGIRRAAARSAALPHGARERMLADEDASVRHLALARLPEVDLATAEDIDRRHPRQSKFGDRPADRVVFPPETLRRFAVDPDPWMRILALRDPRLPAPLLERLAADESARVRHATAGHPRVPTAALLRLLGDAQDHVAQEAAAAPGLPAEAMRALLDRAEAAGALAAEDDDTCGCDSSAR